MKLLVSILSAVLVLATTCLSTSAQIVDKPETDKGPAIDRTRTVSAADGCLWMGGEQLSSGDIISLFGQDTYEAYDKARRQISNGSIMVTTGATMLGVGIGYALGRFIASRITGNHESVKESLVTGGIVAAVGAIPLAVGIPIARKGEKNLESIAAGYSEGSVAGTLSIGTTPNGIGLCFRF